MNRKDIIKWLLESDVSIQYQVYRDLLSIDRKDLRNKILLFLFNLNLRMF